MELPPKKDQPIGMKVGNYVITEAIGAGGMGAVYLAEHPEIGRRVAVKMLPRHLGLAPGLADRFRAEARAVTLIEHRNVIEIYDYGQTDDGQLYYIMELLKGHELLDEIRAHSPMPAEKVQPYLEQICAALQAAHDSGVVHRDLKPENIFVLDRPTLAVKVLDFGLAKLLDDTDPGASQTATGQIMGTPLTIAPEQAAGRPQEIGPHTDIYSLGVILHWMLAGEPPFKEESTALLLAKHISDPAPPLAERCPSVPPEVADIVDRCLLKPPEDRPASALMVHSRFAAALECSEPTAMPQDVSAGFDMADTAPSHPGDVTSAMSRTSASMVGEMATSPSRRPTRDRNLLLAAIGLLLVLGVGAFLISRAGSPVAPEQPPVTEAPPTKAAAALAPAPPDAGPPRVAAKPDAAVVKSTPAPAPRKKAATRKARKARKHKRSKKRRAPRRVKPTVARPAPAPAPAPAKKPPPPAATPPMGESTVPLEL